MAVALQCLPLLAAGGCVANGVTGNHSYGLSFELSFCLWWSIFLWGLGYVYIGQKARYAVVAICGPLLSLTSCVFLAGGGSVDFEHGPSGPEELSAASTVAYLEALLIAGAVLLLAVDAWRLAVAHNASLDDGAHHVAMPKTAGGP